MKNINKILLAEFEGETTKSDNIKMNFKETGFEDMNWIHFEKQKDPYIYHNEP